MGIDVRALLPRVAAAVVLSATAALQVAPDLIAVPLMVVLSAALGRRALIKPKRNAAWQVVPNLWGYIVAGSGSMKSACLQLALSCLITLEEEAIRTPGSRRRYLTNDPTTEKLLEILVDNPAGILVWRDELTGFVGNLSRRGREADRQMYSEGWPGNQPFSQDRIGRGTIRVPRHCISILGGIQPDPWQELLKGSAKAGILGDGFIQRFQMAVWPDPHKDYVYEDEPPDAESEQRLAAVFRRIVAMPAEDPVEFGFDDDAQEMFVDWFEKLERRIRNETMPEIVREHISKYRSLMPSLALILHVAEKEEHSTLIPLHRAVRAIEWCRYLESHLPRLYSCVIGSANPSAELLAVRIKEGKLGQRFSIRELSEKGWSGLNTPGKVRVAVKILEDAAWVRQLPRDPNQVGRPSEGYEVNPRIAEV
ncbi:MAG: DUF3987 domain-containing protein [Acidobacteriales bacterium]|nr:DUF3987 domain-containing protein [Terriglobales bacterium]